jgi:hypothetical protein
LAGIRRSPRRRVVGAVPSFYRVGTTIAGERMTVMGAVARVVVVAGASATPPSASQLGREEA